MKKLALMLGLGLFLLLAACNQNPNTDLGAQGIEYGQVRFGVVSDYLEGAEETNFNGQWDRGEFLVPNVELRFTPVNEDGKPIGEAVSYFTSQAATPEEAVTFKLPAGIYQPEVVLPTNLRGGDDYAWKPVGPIIKLPPFKLDPKLLLDREYTVACGVGRKWVSISSGIEFESSPCYFSGGGSDDGLYVSANPLTTPCDARSADVAVSVAYKSTPTPVTLSASNLPAGMISTFNPATTTTSSILTLDVSGVEAGDYTITVQDSRGVSVPVNVRVRGVTVNFADANLGAAVRGALNIPAPTPICAYDMLALTHLDYDDNVYQIEGLQYAKNLEDLGAAGFYHTDVTALTGLRKLARLRLVRSHINIDQLSRLQSLKELWLCRSYLGYSVAPSVPSSIEILLANHCATNSGVASEAFAYLPNLKWYRHHEMYTISWNDFALLAHSLTNLEHLEIVFDRLYGQSLNLSFLSQLTDLNYVSVHNPWAPGQPLQLPSSPLPNLTELHLSHFDIQNLASLAVNVSLQRLTLQYVNITTVQPLSGLTNLQYLDLRNNPISDISALVQNTGLGSGDEIFLQNTSLNLNDPNDPDLSNIQTLQSRGVTVRY